MTSNENKTSGKSFSRRKFLLKGAIVLGGIVAGTYLGRSPIRRKIAQTAENLDFPSYFTTNVPDFWFEVLPDNTILLKSPKVEMGQGIFTGLAMLAAEELEMPLERIVVEPANTKTGAIDLLGTGGSNSILSLYKPIRELAATMREMLKGAAAQHWGVEISAVTAQEGVLSAGDKKMTYVEIANINKKWKVPKTPHLKPNSAFKYVGKDVKRIDLKPKVMGAPIFAIDGTLPEMLYAITLNSPYIGGKLKSAMTDEAAKSDGVVQIFQDKEKDLIAVVAKTRYAAELALGKIKADWDVPKSWQQADIDAIITVGNGTEVSVQKRGDVQAILEKEGIFTQEYRTPLGAHAQIEPNGTIAHVEKDKATIIIGTQAVLMVREDVANALGMSRDQVEVKVTFLGGGFGRRYFRNNAVAAALISKAIGKPVHVFHTREQEFQNSYYRPSTHHVLRAKMDKEGKVKAISHDLATGDMMFSNLPGGKTMLNLMGADMISAGHGAGLIYSNVPNVATTMWQNPFPFQVGIWRSVGIFANTFAIESFVNELAHHLKKDPIALRLQMLEGTELIHKRYKSVLETLAQKSNWNSPKAEGVGRGIAITDDRKSIAAAVIEVKMIEDKIKITKVTHVTDAGLIINREGVKTQVEGCIMMGISASIYEKVTIKDGQIAVTNYHEYPLATLADVPEMNIILLEGTDHPYGVGEPPLGPIAPAIAAAIFDLTGKRFRTLPLR